MAADPESRRSARATTFIEPGRRVVTERDPSPAQSTSAATGIVQPEAPSEPEDTFETRYEAHASLGEGGMGEVRLCADHRIGREIAMKVIRAAREAQPDMRRRFLREARVQGQLEHPAIVPVYDLGRDPNGASYFTMKRVRGMTLEQLLDGLRWEEPALRKEYTRHKLLTSFGNACLAVHFAHSRGVLHRDLKPDNLMLGDFGEVYILDWGLAKVMSNVDPHLPRAPDSERGRAVTPDTFLEADESLRTENGSVLGTPGYMAPEQIHGNIDALDGRTDVYALGAILFEILTLEPLHGKGSASECLKRTLLGADVRVAVRAKTAEMPPELEAICTRATALDPRDRFESARSLYEAIEAYLSGDRDVERRREAAREHAGAAKDAAMRAIAGGAGSAAERTRAMREVSRAVALDPENAEALHTLVRLFTEAPRELPREAQLELEATLMHSQRVGARTVALAYLTWILFAPLVLSMGVRNVGWGIACDLLFLGAAASALLVGRAHPRAMSRATDAAMVLSTLGLIASTGMLGPFILLPVIAALNTIAFVVIADRSRRALAIALGCLAVVVPLALEQLGFIPASDVFEGGMLKIAPQIAALPKVPTLTFLVLANIAAIVMASLAVARFRDALHSSQERLYFHTWQLRQFVPGEAYGAVVPPAPPTVSRMGRAER